MTEKFVRSLIEAHPSIQQVWLIGSRAQCTALLDSDWDYLVFADEDVLSSLLREPQFNWTGTDLLVVFDGDHFRKPWADQNGQVKSGSLSDWEWKLCSTVQATYKATKFSDDGNWARVARATLVWP